MNIGHGSFSDSSDAVSDDSDIEEDRDLDLDLDCDMAEWVEVKNILLHKTMTNYTFCERKMNGL